MPEPIKVALVMTGISVLAYVGRMLVRHGLRRRWEVTAVRDRQVFSPRNQVQGCAPAALRA